MATKEETHAFPSFRHDRALHLTVALFLVLSVLNLGCMARFGTNHSMEIPMLEQSHDAGLFPNDAIRTTFSHHASYYWKIVSLLTRFVPLDPCLRMLVIVQRIVMLYAFGALARFFAPRSNLALVACLGVLALGIPYLRLGSSDVGLAIYAEQSSLALALVFLSFVAFLRSSRTWWAFFLALAVHCNVFFGVEAFGYFAITFLFVREVREAWRKWVPATLLLGVLVLPLIPLLLPALRGSTVSSTLWIAAHRIRSAHHLFPATWPITSYLELAALTTFALGSMRFLLDRDDIRIRIAGAWTVAAAFWLGLAFVASGPVHSVSLLCMQPGRGLAFTYDLAVVLSICSLATLSETRSRYWMIPLSGLLVWIGDTQGMTSAQLTVPALVFLTMVVLGMNAIQSRIQGDSSVLAIALTLCLLPRFLMGMGDRNPSGSLAVVFTRDSMPTYEALAQGAKARSNPNETFLVPTEWELFRPISERSVFVTYKDGTASFYERDHLAIWLERLRAIGFDLLGPGVTPANAGQGASLAYDALDDAKVADIAQHYRIDYWVVPESKVSAYPIVFGRDGYKVLRLAR